jgi:hypothetical protein
MWKPSNDSFCCHAAKLSFLLVGIGCCFGCESRTEIQFPLPTVTKGERVVVVCPRKSDVLEIEVQVACQVIYDQKLVVMAADSEDVLFDSSSSLVKVALPSFPGSVSVPVPHLADERRRLVISASGLCSDKKTHAAGSATCSIARED